MLLIVLVVSLIVLVSSYSINNLNSRISNRNRLLSMNMNKSMKNMIGTIAISSLVLNPFNTNHAIAAVGEGDLPDGAMAFSKLLKYQKEWTKLAENMKSRTVQMDDKEIVGTKLFLKQLANEYNDMNLLAKGILDSSKAEKAKEIAKDFRVKVRECDDAMTDGNTNKIIENYPITSSEIAEFLELLSDVPDEL